jgi:Tfp pilus assembly protein PilX
MAKSPDEMSASERIEEMVAILVEGMLRLKCKKARKSNNLRDNSVDFSANQSVHALTNKKGEANE